MFTSVISLPTRVFLAFRATVLPRSSGCGAETLVGIGSWTSSGADSEMLHLRAESPVFGAMPMIRRLYLRLARLRCICRDGVWSRSKAMGLLKGTESSKYKLAIRRLRLIEAPQVCQHYTSITFLPPATPCSRLSSLIFVCRAIYSSRIRARSLPNLGS